MREEKLTLGASMLGHQQGSVITVLLDEQIGWLPNVEIVEYSNPSMTASGTSRTVLRPWE